MIAGPAGICLSVFGGISCAVGLQEASGSVKSTAAGRAVRQPIEEIDFVLLVELEQGIVLAASAVGADATGVQGPPSETHVFRQAVKGQVGSGLCGQDAVAIVGVPYRKVAFLTGRKSIVGITGVGAAHRLCRAASAYLISIVISSPGIAAAIDATKPAGSPLRAIVIAQVGGGALGVAILPGCCEAWHWIVGNDDLIA